MLSPSSISPQLVSAAKVPPEGKGWVHELKHDGHRVLAFLDRGRVNLRSRNGYDATRRYAAVAAMTEKLPARSAIIDGEVAVPDESGVTHIAHLERALVSGGAGLAFYAFDLLWLEGSDLRRRPLIDRKASLADLLRHPPARFLYSEHLACDGRVLFERVGELGVEGIVSKRIDAPYTSGSSRTWLKCKHAITAEYPVIGYVPDGKRIEALLIAERRGRELRPIGRVEFRKSGALPHDARQVFEYLTRSRDRRACYVEPRLVARVKHFGRTAEGYLRAPVLESLSVDQRTAG
jgi:bifunctional non-homologous end joining protein LigD